MKLNLLIVLALANLTGCGKTSQPTPITKGSFTFTDNFSLPLPTEAKAGQPATLTLAGVIVSENGEIDPHFSIIQTGGQDATGMPIKVDKANFVTEKVLAKSEIESLSKISDGSYISMGCETDNADIRSLIQGKVKKDQSEIIMADTVLLCGPLKPKALGLHILAKTVFLRDLDISSIDFAARFDVTADNLILFGNSKLKSQGEILGMVPMAGPEIAIRVVSVIEGPGTLTIQDLGASVEKTKN